VVDAEEEAVVGEGPDVEGEEDKELLVSLSHTVIDPGTVVVHLLNTPLTDGAVVCPVRFDAATLGTLEYDLPLLEAHPLYVLLGGVTSGHGSWVCEHCSDM